ncbi:SGNH/GDSL hydrolase family protein [Glycomyces buryatensis]|uniref:SGNH/GDSL hydrolase family protein n=1 Tax=Glycomyces buryatensis TaxID=2570927 RepID=A0A4S8QLD1_9ACTN|nr:SGNH/GDSL hydrolase family protein [Glycomyces buryatensis]THV41534.1 SGNH/GDSL hydrolase family protein [Glycomyces buryatensis]
MSAEFSSFVAIGDSFTEGVGDPNPDGEGFRGWADLFAHCYAGMNPDFAYANLAVRGRLFDRIVDEQVVPAIKQSPDLISFAAGGNDALRPGFNPTQLSTRAHEVVRLLKASGAEVMLFTCADVTCHIPGMKMLRKRFIATNDAYKRVAKRHNAVLIDLWADEAFTDPRLWSEDRLHLNSLGHQRVAFDVCEVLGVEPDPAWLKSLPDAPVVRRDQNGVAWAGKHLAPWVKRRLTGKSSGDTVDPKRPKLSQVES